MRERRQEGDEATGSDTLGGDGRCHTRFHGNGGCGCRTRRNFNFRGSAERNRGIVVA